MDRVNKNEYWFREQVYVIPLPATGPSTIITDVFPPNTYSSYINGTNTINGLILETDSNNNYNYYVNRTNKLMGLRIYGTFIYSVLSNNCNVFSANFDIYTLVNILDTSNNIIENFRPYKQTPLKLQLNSTVSGCLATGIVNLERNITQQIILWPNHKFDFRAFVSTTHSNTVKINISFFTWQNGGSNLTIREIF
jgi:hypothetical protein